MHVHPGFVLYYGMEITILRLSPFRNVSLMFDLCRNLTGFFSS